MILDKIKSLDIQNLIDEEISTKLTAIFSDVLGISLFLAGRDGELSVRSTPTNAFCRQIQSSKIGCKRCEADRREISEFVFNFGKPEIVECHSRMRLIAAPIFVDYEIVGVVGGCQILARPLTKAEISEFRKVARAMDLKDVDEAIKDLKRCRVVTEPEASHLLQRLVFWNKIFSILAEKEVELVKMTSKISNMYEELVLLYEVGESIGTLLEPKEVTDIVLERAMGILDADLGFFALRNELTGDFEVKSVKGIDTSVFDKKIDFGKGVFKRVLDSGDHEMLRDVLADPAFEKVKFPIKVLLVTPLKVKGKVIGLLNVGNDKRKTPFSIAERRLIHTLASETAAFIESARLYKDIHNLFLDTVSALASAIDAKDPYTRGHSERVTQIAIAIAEEMGFSVLQKARVKLCGLFHDIGKIGVLEEILTKNGFLEDHEFDLIKKHPVIGAKIIKNIKHLQRIVPGVLHHHERFDGDGYPNGKRGKEIPIEARIISVADSFDAMTLDRPYRKGMKREFAREEIRKCSGRQFDPRVVKAFLQAFDKGKII